MWHEKTPGSPIFRTDFGFSLIDERLDKGLKADAVGIFRLYASFDQSFAQLRAGRRQVAAARYQWTCPRVLPEVLVLAPADSEAAERLKSLGEPRRD